MIMYFSFSLFAWSKTLLEEKNETKDDDDGKYIILSCGKYFIESKAKYKKKKNLCASKRNLTKIWKSI